MEKENDFVALVDAIYEGALSPEGLEAALRRMAFAFDGREAGCVLWDRRGGSVLAEIGATCPESCSGPSSNSLHDEVVLCAQHAGHSLCCRLSLCDFHPSVPLPARALECRVVVHRESEEGAFGDAAVLAMQRLQPHLRLALRTFAEITRQRLVSQATAAALDALGSAAIMTDVEGRILFVNAMAESLLRTRKGFARLDGRLVPTHRESRAKFASLVAQSKGGTKMPHGDGHDCLVRLFPLASQAGGTPLVLVLVCDPRRSRCPSVEALRGCFDHQRVLLGLRRSRCPSVEALRGVFGLTQREADLAQAIGEGKTLKEFAAEQEVGLETARSHLHAVFAKTDTHRQAELVRLLAGLPSTVTAD